MPSGNSCYNLGTDKCAQITGSGNSTSTMGVSGMGTTFINTIDISELDIKNGGRTNYTIKVDKRDAQDRIYMHITGRNGNTNIFQGTDILSESGVTSGFQEYSGGFDFAGTITKIIVEVGGRDINLAIGPLFDDITINVLYNVISTIVQESITSVEMWVAYGGSTETEVIDIVENTEGKYIIRSNFNARKKGELSHTKLIKNIVYYVMHGYAIINTIDELENYIYYSIDVKINNKKNKWRNKYENKIINTNCR